MAFKPWYLKRILVCFSHYLLYKLSQTISQWLESYLVALCLGSPSCTEIKFNFAPRGAVCRGGQRSTHNTCKCRVEGVDRVNYFSCNNQQGLPWVAGSFTDSLLKSPSHLSCFAMQHFRLRIIHLHMQSRYECTCMYVQACMYMCVLLHLCCVCLQFSKKLTMHLIMHPN